MKTSLIFGLTLLFSSYASSSLLEVDIYGDGSNFGFQRTDASLIWLDIGQTQNLSVNQVLSMTKAGEKYEGWRLPTELEVTELWSAVIGNKYTYILSSPLSYYLNEPLGSPILNYWYSLAEIMGTTQSGVYNEDWYGDYGVEWFSSIGLYQGDNGLLLASSFATYQFYQGYVEGHIYPVDTYERICVPNDSACLPRDYWNEELRFSSTMLVKDDEIKVSEPSCIIVFCVSLLLLHLSRVRKY